MDLKFNYSGLSEEAGCDEAGRGCLAGPVYAAAVILDADNPIQGLSDSKKLSAPRRERLRKEIEDRAIAWAVASASHQEIDEINILNASVLAMHRALEQLGVRPAYILIDGISFRSFNGIPYACMPKGDATWQSIAAASILAKTYRDDHMRMLSEQFPVYQWNRNMGYPTPEHKRAMLNYGPSPFHRKSFHPRMQLTLKF